MHPKLFFMIRATFLGCFPLNLHVRCSHDGLPLAAQPQVEAALGGHPDAWSLVRAHGRLKFQTAAFPSNVTHVTRRVENVIELVARTGLVSLEAQGSIVLILR